MKNFRIFETEIEKHYAYKHVVKTPLIPALWIPVNTMKLIGDFDQSMTIDWFYFLLMSHYF